MEWGKMKLKSKVDSTMINNRDCKLAEDERAEPDFFFFDRKAINVPTYFIYSLWKLLTVLCGCSFTPHSICFFLKISFALRSCQLCAWQQSQHKIMYGFILQRSEIRDISYYLLLFCNRQSCCQVAPHRLFTYNQQLFDAKAVIYLLVNELSAPLSFSWKILKFF